MVGQQYTKEQLQALATTYATKYGVDPDFYKALITQESGWNPNAKSKVGALGLAQFMPATAEGLKINPLDPHQALDGGARYLASKLGEFNGSYSLAAASYNAGSGAVHKYGGIPPYHETQNYVKTIMGATQHAKGLQTVAGQPQMPQAPQELKSNIAGDLEEPAKPGTSANSSSIQPYKSPYDESGADTNDDKEVGEEAPEKKRYPTSKPEGYKWPGPVRLL